MVAMPRIYDQNLDSAPANYTPLNPTSFLTRAECVYCDHAAMTDGRVGTDMALNNQIFTRARLIDQRNDWPLALCQRLTPRPQRFSKKPKNDRIDATEFFQIIGINNSVQI